jgi:predicted TIM-barrel enzyme
VADLIIVYNSGRYRMAGRGSLAGLMPYGDANAIVVEMAAEVLPVVTETPVLERTEGVVGFFGASSIERLPTEIATTENVRRFKSLGSRA